MAPAADVSADKTERIPPRARILAVARKLFYRDGIRAVGVDAIAEAAGTNKMTLYRHFSSKDALVADYLRKSARNAESYRDLQVAMNQGGLYAAIQGIIA